MLSKAVIVNGARSLAEVAAVNRSPAIAALLARATPPEACGPDIPVSPARGAFLLAPQVSLVPKGAEDWAESDVGFAGRSPLRAADVFDRIAASAEREQQPAPFSAGQVAMARHYRDLVERHDGRGVKCSQLDRTAGGGGGFMDAFLDEAREIDAIRRRIGAGSTLALRRIRPSVRGSRRSIPDRQLVDRVCIGDQGLADVLRAFGWVVKGDTRQAAREALGAALDRMIGYRGQNRC